MPDLLFWRRVSTGTLEWVGSLSSHGGLFLVCAQRSGQREAIAPFMDCVEGYRELIVGCLYTHPTFASGPTGGAGFCVMFYKPAQPVCPEGTVEPRKA